VVLVTTRRLRGADTPWPSEAYASPRTYADAVARAGGRPLLAPPVTDGGLSADDWLEGVDGLLLTGGPDVDPAWYGRQPYPKLYGVDAEVDELELDLVRAAADRGLPVLAICRGLQVLNVARGGTLDQHISDRPDLANHGWPGTFDIVEHDVTIEPRSRLATALGITRAVVSSVHHQAIDDLGRDLAVTAWSDDELVEGVEATDDDDGWIVGVQWHPEWQAGNDTVQHRLFAAFVDRARLRR
jgi:gamma-glutamyl-gamma-aminobutyrate hydrolase PuuD